MVYFGCHTVQNMYGKGGRESARPSYGRLKLTHISRRKKNQKRCSDHRYAQITFFIKYWIVEFCVLLYLDCDILSLLIKLFIYGTSEISGAKFVN